MATKAKENLAIRKERKAPSSNSHITSTKKTTKKTTTSSTPSEKHIQNHLKATATSRLETPFSSSKQPKNESIRPMPSRRGSLDKPLSSSNLTKQKQPNSPAGLHKTPVSSGTKERKLRFSTSNSSAPVRSTNPSKPFSERTSKTLLDGKVRPILGKSTPGRLSTSTSTKKVASSTNSMKKPPKATTETMQVLNIVETEDVKEVTNHKEVEVVKEEENEEYNVELVCEISDIVESDYEHQQGLEGYEYEYDHEPHNEEGDDDEKVISTVPQEEEEEEEEEPQEKETKEEYEEEEEEEEEESNKQNEVESKEVVVVNEKEKEDEVTLDDHKSVVNNNEEEEEMEEKELLSEEAKGEAKQQLPSGKGKGNKKEYQVYNDVIEETAKKLMEGEMKNKVMALAGAFQTVIDCQTTSIYEAKSLIF